MSAPLRLKAMVLWRLAGGVLTATIIGAVAPPAARRAGGDATSRRRFQLAAMPATLTASWSLLSTAECARKRLGEAADPSAAMIEKKNRSRKGKQGKSMDSAGSEPLRYHENVTTLLGN
jgi:hypothetical protein